MSERRLQVIIVAENASARFGGEAVLPLHYFRRLRQRDADVRLIVHERVRDELTAELGDAISDVTFVSDTALQVALDRVGRRLPGRLRDFTTAWLISVLTAVRQRGAVKRLIKSGFGHVVHEPIPVSPKLPSFMYGFGIPVVIGPMNGGMNFPAAFQSRESAMTRVIINLGRTLSTTVNALVPGKKKAALLLYANPRTAAALPANASPHRALMVENGVDLGVWSAPESEPVRDASEPVQFVFMGRLVAWKAVDVLLEAVALTSRQVDLKLVIVGDGPERSNLEALSDRLELSSKVEFMGFQAQSVCAAVLARSRALVLPSLYECGGAVVLEAMAASKPCIATDWGGPSDYLTPDCGFLVAPTSREHMVNEFARLLVQLAKDADLASMLGAKGRLRVAAEFDWNRKIDTILKHYVAVVGAKSQ